MAHLIIRPFDTVYTPGEGAHAKTWHGLNTPIAGGIAADGSNIAPVLRPILTAGFKPDFDAEISDVPPEVAAELGANPTKDWKVLLADLRENGQGVIPVHVVSQSYTIHQNRAIFDSTVAAAKQVLGDGNFEIATVGTLGAYSQFFVSIAVKGESEFNVADAGAREMDLWASYFNAVSSHNSLVASQVMLSLIRIVCMNTVLASLSEADGTGQNAKFRHSANSGELITPEVFGANLQRWMDEKAKIRALLAALKATPMSLDGFRAFAAGIFSNATSDVLTTTSANRIRDMEALFVRGLGNSGKSAYDALNAFTEYFSHGAGVGNPRNVSANKRLASASWGQGANWKNTAMSALSNVETFAEVIARGERMWSDRLLVEAGKGKGAVVVVSAAVPPPALPAPEVPAGAVDIVPTVPPDASPVADAPAPDAAPAPSAKPAKGKGKRK